ncbi:hypothetical protein [Streptomyces sp. LN499]|uniref:hypothetical protein n=1 Tax=Streptomyces sp. LN499 TaxID=3112977 RepID=UPI00371ECBF9
MPHGEDLDLRIGWDRFERLVLDVSSHMLGLRGIKFRRYGVQGQAQHGIDLAGREPDGSYTVVQCKDYQQFTARDLRAAVAKFISSRRPFGAHRLIIATSSSTEATQVMNELRKLQDAHDDLDLDLWGSVQINEKLRNLGDVVARFWTRETAETFCTGAPSSGVPVPLPDRQEQAEKILIGPLKTNDVAPILRRADDQRTQAPEESARLYGELADRLDEAGYRGHAVTMRGKQLDALMDAGLTDQAADLAAQLAVTALHFGDRDEPRRLMHRLQKLARDADLPPTPRAASTQRHLRLVRASVNSVLHPLGICDELRTALGEPSPQEPAYQPLLVLLLAEQLMATDPSCLPSIDALIETATRRAATLQSDLIFEDVVVRLRLVRAEYNTAERTALSRSARFHQVTGRHAALINAREARRLALEGRPDEALECWRAGVYEAIHVDLVEDAADWLYAIRAVNVQYGPLTPDIDDEHRLAQALRTTGSGRLLDRMRSPRQQALSAVVRDKHVEAALSARRWLTDTVITGDWASEFEALDLLGDLYRDSHEPVLAARCYERAGKDKKLSKLAAEGDFVLPLEALKDEPWWVLHARAALVQAQADLIDDDVVGDLLDQLTALAERGRAGELTESRFRSLTDQVIKSACTLAVRGTEEQALAVLSLLAPDVHRGPNQASRSDESHATACVAIANAHRGAAFTALTRLFDLADVGAQKALELVVEDKVIGLLIEQKDDAQASEGAPDHHFSGDDLNALRARVGHLDDSGRYLADVARLLVDPLHPAVRERAEQACERILQRPDPVPGRTSFGTRLVPDSYLANSLDSGLRLQCFEKLMTIAGDSREVALTRQDALTGGCNLITDLPVEVRQETFRATKCFVLGEQSPSYLDDEVASTPHRLSSFKLSMGSASLRGKGLLLALATATSPEDHAWVREQAISLLRTHEADDLFAAATTLSRLPDDAVADVDASLMAAHNSVVVRQASAVLCLRNPARYQDVAMRLAQDSDFRVRRVLAEAAADQSGGQKSGLAAALLELLALDRRRSVRAAAGA